MELDPHGGGNSNLLNITVLTDKIESKGLVTGGYLDSEASIGVTVTNTSGGNYDNTAYNNIQFTSSGTSTSQKWSGGTVKLSATNGYCYAYYPYSSSATSITAIPVTAGGTDYMYAERVTVNDKDKNATLNMKHALSAIRFALKKGTYTGTGAVSSVSVASSALGSSGTLNAQTGGVIAANLGTAVSQSASFNLSTTEQNVDVVMVPSGSAGTITLSVTIDGKVYSTEVSSTTIKQGSCYTYTITVDAGALALSGVKVGDWGYSDNGAPTITAGGYTVTFGGNLKNLAFSNEINSDGSISITAVGIKENYQPREVSTNSGTLTQDVSTIYRRMHLSDIESDIILTFAGVRDLRWDSLSDGIYAVGLDESPVNISNATTDCIGVAIINSITGQKLMIEKFEDANTSYVKSYTEHQATGTDYSKFYWGVSGYTMESLGFNDYVTFNAVNKTYTSGYLPNKKGTYYSPSTTKHLGLPATWPTSGYALSDRAGYTHSQNLMQVSIEDEYNECPKMGQLLKTFIASSDGLGYSNWYIPACGQLALFYVYKSDINTALSAIGGTLLNDDDYYYTSTDRNLNSGWYIDLNNGYVSIQNKFRGQRVRFVRDL